MSAFIRTKCCYVFETILFYFIVDFEYKAQQMRKKIKCHTFEVPIEIQEHMKLFFVCVNHESWWMLMRDETERLNWRFISFLKNMIGFDFILRLLMLILHLIIDMDQLWCLNSRTILMSRGNGIVIKSIITWSIWWFGVRLSIIWEMFLFLATHTHTSVVFLLPIGQTTKEMNKRLSFHELSMSFIYKTNRRVANG